MLTILGKPDCLKHSAVKASSLSIRGAPPLSLTHSVFLPHKERGSKTGFVHSVGMRKEDLRCPEPPLGPFEEACMGSTLYDEANILNSLPHCFCFTQSQASLVFRKSVCSLYVLNVGLATHISANSLGRSWGVRFQWRLAGKRKVLGRESKEGKEARATITYESA